MLQKTVALDYLTWKKLQILKTNKQQRRFEETIKELLIMYENKYGPIKEE